MGIEHIYEKRRQQLGRIADQLFPDRGQKKLLAERLGRDPNYVSRLLSAPEAKGHKRIGEELARDFETKLGLAEYSLDGIQATREEDGLSVEDHGLTNYGLVRATRHDAVFVPYYPDVPAAAGHGCVPLDEANVTVLEIARSLLERCGVSPSDAALLQADGDSMRGVIEHGDLMVINTAEQDVREGRVFVVSVDGELLVKRIQRIPRGIKLVSENPIYEPITIMEDDQDTNVRLIGRVALAWSMTGFM